MIYVFDNLNSVSERQYQKLFERLPSSRKARASILEGNSKKIAILEYFLLKKLLNLKENFDFSYNQNGKPQLDEYNFNFSHCEDVFCIAIGESQIGIDIEKTRKYDERFAKFILNDDELAFIEKQSNKDKYITKLWTQKEATIKCLGLSMSTSLKNIIDTKRFIYSFKKYKNYRICQCALNK